jgi:Uma2 family endonuclease
MSQTSTKYPEPFTYEKYCTLPENALLEIIGGVVYDMTAAPSTKHQTLVGNIFIVLKGYLSGKACTPFMAPLDVVLDDINVVEPDLFVVCDQSKITEKNISGAPDLIIEVLSPSSSLKDRREKKWLYQQHGVKEYLIANPMDETIERYWLENDGKYGVADIFGCDEKLPSRLFPDLLFDLRIIFEKEDMVAESHIPTWLVEK